MVPSHNMEIVIVSDFYFIKSCLPYVKFFTEIVACIQVFVEQSKLQLTRLRLGVWGVSSNDKIGNRINGFAHILFIVAILVIKFLKEFILYDDKWLYVILYYIKNLMGRL